MICANGTGFELRFNLATEGLDDITTAKSAWTSAGGGTIHASTNQVNLFDNASNWYCRRSARSRFFDRCISLTEATAMSLLGDSGTFDDPAGVSSDASGTDFIQFNLGQSGTKANEYIVPFSFTVTREQLPP